MKERLIFALNMELASLKLFLRQMDGKLTNSEINGVLDKMNEIFKLLEHFEKKNN